MADEPDGIEQELLAEKERLRTTLASIGDAVVNTDVDGRVVFLNPIAEALTGWSSHDALGLPVDQVVRLVDELSGAPIDDPTLRALRDGVVIHLENHSLLIARDGTHRPIEDAASPIRDRGGKTIGGVFVFRDVTERRHADEANARLAAIVESSDDAIVSKTLDGVIRSWNAGAERLFGHVAADAIGQPITLIIPPELWDEERQILARLARGERIEHFRTERVRRDGTRVEVSLTVSPVRDREGRIIGASKIARDVTHQMQLERDLEARVRELAAANQQKDKFVALLAHELRNPLAPVRMALEIIRRAGSDAVRVAEARDIIERQIGHLVRLVDDLLDASRLNRDMLHLEIRRVRLDEVVRDAVEVARPLVDATGDHLTVSLPEASIELEADATRLTQILGNLLTNSAKYSDPGTRIELTGDIDGDEVVLTVHDEGHGIAADALPRVFDAFARIGRTDGGGGLGLGLSIVKGLVELHGGSVSAESPGPGRGSTFTVRIPRTQHRAPAPPPPAPPRRRHGHRVLVVDDNHDAADTLATMLEMLDHEAHVAYGGAEALELAERLRPELVLMDLGMPGMDGIATVRELRARPWGAAPRVVALTGWGQEQDRRRTAEAGFDGHLVKPATVEQIEQLLDGLPSAGGEG